MSGRAKVQQGGERRKLVDRWKFENSVQPGSSRGLGGIVDGLLNVGPAAQKASREWEEGAFGIGDTCLQQRASSRWVQQVERRVLSTAHQPPACACLPNNLRGRGARGRLGQRSRIFRRLVIARPLAVRPRPHFAAGAPNLSCPPATHSTHAQLLLRFSRAPGA